MSDQAPVGVAANQQMIDQVATQARTAQRGLAAAPPEQRSAALHAIADQILAQADAILAANAADLADGAHLPGPMQARLRLDQAKLTAIADGVRAVAALPEVLGERLAQWSPPSAIQIEQVRVPIGVIGIIYEARPNVTADAAALCLKTGNAVLLKGGKEAARSNQAIGTAIQAGLNDAGLPAEAVQILPATRESASALMGAVGLVDLLIPRGGAGLIQAVVRESRIPVIETGAGGCHTYVHQAADLAMAEQVLLNAKCSNPAVCNATETLLVDRAVAATFLRRLAPRLQEAGVAVKGCPESLAHLDGAEPATEADWATEWNDLVLNVRVVDDLAAALHHIDRYGTKHSEAIITAESGAAERFLGAVDAAAVYWNASTRFTDGGEFGFGAEIGISTQKLHARGPMGLTALTSYKYLVRGAGATR